MGETYEFSDIVGVDFSKSFTEHPSKLRGNRHPHNSRMLDFNNLPGRTRAVRFVIAPAGEMER